jgi:acyl-CoA synthetase (AMP-forming)/AMP-acid ligase II
VLIHVSARSGLSGTSAALVTSVRSWSYAEVMARSESIAGTLARLDVGPERPLGLLLPPVPTAAMAALAALRLGATVVPCDPMRAGEELRDRMRAIGGGVMVTLDLTRLQRRWIGLLDQTELSVVLVEKMADLLPFPRNLLMPLMRGGEIAAVPRDPRLAALPRLLQKDAGGVVQARPSGALLDTESRTIGEEAVLDAVGALTDLAGGARRWLLAHHLDDAWPLAAMLTPLTAGRELIMLPRLDARTVAAALNHERPQVAILSGKVAVELAASPPDGGALSFAVVPPHVPENIRDELAHATGARVVVWQGP